jgi:hypothetical protein
VKLVWTREDDMRGGYYRPFGIHRMRGVVRDGKIEAWSDTMVGQSIMKGSAFEAMTFKDGLDSTAYEGSHDIPYEVANFNCDLHQVDVGIPVLWWRSVGHTHTGYAVEAFVDELLQAAGQDPVEGRLAMMGKSPRHASVLKAVAELADWKGAKMQSGRARGVTVVESFGTYVAQVVELSMGEEGAALRRLTHLVGAPPFWSQVGHGEIFPHHWARGGNVEFDHHCRHVAHHLVSLLVLLLPGLFQIAHPARHFADDVDRFPVLDETLRDGINAHRPNTGIGIERIGAAAEALVHRVLQQAMNEDNVATGQFLAAGHPVLDELAMVADELEVEVLHLAAGVALAG